MQPKKNINKISEEEARKKIEDFQAARANKTPLPYGFRYARNGSIERIVSTNKDGGDEVWGILCSPIEFLATTEDAEGKKPGLLIRIRNQNGRWNELAIPISGLIGDGLLVDLLDHGLRFVPVGRDLAELKRLLVGITSTSEPDASLMLAGTTIPSFCLMKS